jgi:hypothetical protein
MSLDLDLDFKTGLWQHHSSGPSLGGLVITKGRRFDMPCSPGASLARRRERHGTAISTMITDFYDYEKSTITSLSRLLTKILSTMITVVASMLTMTQVLDPVQSH